MPVSTDCANTGDAEGIAKRISKVTTAGRYFTSHLLRGPKITVGNVWALKRRLSSARGLARFARECTPAGLAVRALMMDSLDARLPLARQDLEYSRGAARSRARSARAGSSPRHALDQVNPPTIRACIWRLAISSAISLDFL